MRFYCILTLSYIFTSFALVEKSSLAAQDTISPDYDSWNIHMNNGTIYSFVTLDSTRSSYLFISRKEKINIIVIQDIQKIESNKVDNGYPTEMLGLIGGALIGGTIGIFVAPKTTFFGKTFIPDGEWYIAGGAIIGGTLGYFITKGDGKEVYEFTDRSFIEKIHILNSIINK